MAIIRSTSAIIYQERAGLRIAQIGPVPRLSVFQHPIHGLPLYSPHPSQAYQLAQQSQVPSDSGVSVPWPHHAKGTTDESES